MIFNYKIRTYLYFTDFVISIISVSQNFLTISVSRFKSLKNYRFRSNSKDVK